MSRKNIQDEIDCSIPCPQILRVLSSCPSQRINFINMNSNDFYEIFMIALSITPYPASFIILFTSTFYRTTRTIFILIMVFAQNLLLEIIKNNLRDPRPNYKCNPQYGNPSNHATLFTSIVMWFIMEEYNISKKYQLKNQRFLILLYVCYPFILYSRVHLKYHNLEQTINGFILGIFISVSWFLLCTKYILKKPNFLVNLLAKLRVKNTLTSDSFYGDIYSEYKNSEDEEEIQKKFNEILEKNNQLDKLKTDLKKLTNMIQKMDFMKKKNFNFDELKNPDKYSNSNDDEDEEINKDDIINDDEDNSIGELNLNDLISEEKNEELIEKINMLNKMNQEGNLNCPSDNDMNNFNNNEKESQNNKNK